jgi:hypothetical protein
MPTIELRADLNAEDDEGRWCPSVIVAGTHGSGESCGSSRSTTARSTSSPSRLTIGQRSNCLRVLTTRVLTGPSAMYQEGEDRRLWAALQDAGYPVASPRSLVVTTSGRAQSRVRGGFADSLNVLGEAS